MAARYPVGIEGDGRHAGRVGTAGASENLERYVTCLATPANGFWCDRARLVSGRTTTAARTLATVNSMTAGKAQQPGSGRHATAA